MKRLAFPVPELGPETASGRVCVSLGAVSQLQEWLPSAGELLLVPGWILLLL